MHHSIFERSFIYKKVASFFSHIQKWFNKRLIYAIFKNVYFIYPHEPTCNNRMKYNKDNESAFK